MDVSDLPDQADAADVEVATCGAMIEASEAWAAPAEAVYPWYMDKDFLEPWDTSPDADCMRTLRSHGEKLLAVKHHDGADMTLRVVTPGGRWDNDPDAIGKLVGDTALDWAVTALEEDRISANLAGEIARHAKKMRSAGGRQDALRSVGRVVERWREDGTIPNGLKVVYEDNLHPDGRFLGAPNGVIDLDTGELLTGLQAREKLVTRSIPDPYIPDAQHPDVDRLLSHLPGDSRDYLLGALGFALRGHPSRRFYVLLGPPRGGKSTLLEAIRAALGDVKGIGYGQGIDGAALLEKRFQPSHRAELIGIQDARIAVVSELADSRERLNVPLIKSLDGIVSLTLRDAFEKTGPARPAKATLFVSMNDSDAKRIPLNDEAFRDRIRILPYRAIPEPAQDAEMVNRVRLDSKVRQAMVALLVRSATQHRRTAPPDIPAVASAGVQRFRDSVGIVGEWLLDNIVTDPSAALSADEIWEVLASEIGEPDDQGKIGGWTRQRLLRSLAPEVIKGWPSRAERKGAGGRSLVYHGVRLRSLQDRFEAQP